MEKAQEAYERFKAEYGVNACDGRVEMDPEKVSESLGVKVAKAVSESVIPDELNLGGTKYPTIFVNKLVVYVDDPSEREEGLVPSLKLHADTETLFLFKELELCERGSDVSVKVPTLLTFVNSSDATKNFPQLLFHQLTVVTPRNEDFCTLKTPTKEAMNKDKSFFLGLLGYFKNILAEVDSDDDNGGRAFVDFVMGVLGIGTHNRMGALSSQLKVGDSKFSMNLCGADETLLVSHMCVDREKGMVELTDVCLNNKDTKIASKLVITVDKSTFDIKVTADGCVTLRHDDVCELWKWANEYFVNMGKTAKFTFEQSDNDKKCVVTLTNETLAEISGLNVTATLGRVSGSKVEMDFEQATIKTVQEGIPKILAVATGAKNVANTQKQQQQQPCITLNIGNEAEYDDTPTILSESEFHSHSGSGSNAEKFNDSRRSCALAADINLTTLSVQTLSNLSNTLKEMKYPGKDTLTFTALSVRQDFLMHMDAAHYITSKKPSAIYVRSTPDAKGAYLACFDDLNVYANVDDNAELYVAAFHRLPVAAKRATPVEIYGDSNALFVAAEGSSLLVCPEVLSKLPKTPFVADKRRISVKMDRSSVKLCNRAVTMKTLISVAVVSAESVALSADKPLEDHSALNEKLNVSLDVAGAEIYTVGLLNKMSLPRVKTHKVGRTTVHEAEAHQSPAEFWGSLGFHQAGRFDKLGVSVKYAFPEHCSLGISVDEVEGLEMDFHLDTLFPMVEIYRCLLTHAKSGINEWKRECPQNNAAPETPAKFSSKKFSGNINVMSSTRRSKEEFIPSPPSHNQQQNSRFSTVQMSSPNSSPVNYYSGYAYSTRLQAGLSSTSSATPPGEKKFIAFKGDFDPKADYYDSSMAAGAEDPSSLAEDTFYEDLMHTEVSIRVKEVKEFTLRLNSYNVAQSDCGDDDYSKGSKSKVLFDNESIPDSAANYYYSKSLPKEGYWFGNIVFPPTTSSYSKKSQLSISNMSSSLSSSSEGSKEGEHTLSITVRKAHFSYMRINEACLKRATTKKRVYMWFDSFVAKYDDKVVGEDRRDRLKCSYIPEPASPHSAFFLSFIVPNKGGGDGSDNGNLSIYINPCYISFMQNVLAIFDKYAAEKSAIRKDNRILSKTPLSMDIARITLHPFVLNFDWIYPSWYISFKNVITETQLMSFCPKRHGWGNILEEIISYMRENHRMVLLKDSLATGSDNAVCSMVRVLKSATGIVSKPIQGANHGARNVVMGAVEGTIDFASTLLEETKNVTIMTYNGVYNLCLKGLNYYYGNSNDNDNNNDEDEEDEEDKSNGPCTKLFMSLPFIEAEKKK